MPVNPQAEPVRRPPTPLRAAAGQQISGEDVVFGGAGINKPQLPKHNPSPPFFFAVHPMRWMVRFDDEGAPLLMPDPRRIALQPGVDGVFHRKDQEINFRDAINKACDNGWTPIQHQDGPGGRSYLRQIAVEGGTFYVSCFDRVYAGSSRIECDRRGMKLWFDDLIARGLIPPAADTGLRDLRNDLVKSRLQLAKGAVDDPVLRARRDSYTSMIELITSALDALKLGDPVIGADVPAIPVDGPRGDSPRPKC